MSSIVQRLLTDDTVTWFKSKGTAKSTNSDEKSGLITKILMAVAVAAFLVYMAYLGSKDSRALAKLKHQRDLHVEERKQAMLDWELSELDDAISAKIERIGEAQAEVEEATIKILEMEEKALYEVFRIKAIENWDDMDRYLESIGASSS